ncbi:forkhead box protein M1 isoform 2-T2 [Discoglossus pictus]
MRSSPRRPLILKRRKLSLPHHDAPPPTGTKAQSPAPSIGSNEQSQTTRTDAIKPPVQHQTLSGADGLPKESSRGSNAEVHSIPAGIRVMGHPTTPGTQLVVMPPNSDVQSIIQALTARGREHGGPNKFILINGSSSFASQSGTPVAHIKEEEMESLQPGFTSFSKPCTTEDYNKTTIPKADHREGEELDVSLTNIHWLGKMSSDGLGPCNVKEELEEKENQAPELESVKMEEDSGTLPTQQWQLSVSERPPYSYMALIQFAINSTQRKRMTLKDIYTWIEDHFPYFKHVAKPGWKNSIRHNLSLHDMFVRETSENNKISYWTIHPTANRCLTLDQVFKTSNPMSPVCPEPQKRLIPELNKNTQGAATTSKAPERKMKPLLPRVNSYLIPVQFPVTQPVLIPAMEPVCADSGACDGPRSSKRVRIAPKVPVCNEEPPSFSSAIPVKEEPSTSDLASSSISQSRRGSGSRRKQQLNLPRSEEPELVLPESSGSDSGLDTDFSFLHETQAQEGPSELTQDEGYAFKTPVKDRFLKPPASSTPSKPVESCTLQPWGTEISLPQDPVLDFSPVRIPRGSALTPFKDSLGFLSFGGTPFKDLPIFDSPQRLMGIPSPVSPQLELLESPADTRPVRRCSKELQVGGSANRSLLEGLVLDTTDESLSKILLDISFSGLEEDNGLGVDSAYWGQLLSEFR